MTAFGDMALATKEELASELIGRTKKPALVIFEEDDSRHLRCYQSFCPEGAEVQRNLPVLLRALADKFEDAEFHPAREAYE